MPKLDRDVQIASKDVPEYLRELWASGRPIVVTIDGRAEIVVQDSASYFNLVGLAERAAQLEALRESVAEMKAGLGIPAEDALAEARQVIDRAYLPLQPLRVPGGWLVQHNNGFYEIDPAAEFVSEDDRWWVFKEDMLQMRHAGRDRLLDLGWYPEGDLAGGRYRLVVHEGDFHGRCLHNFTSRDRHELVAEIERLLVAVGSEYL